MRTHAIIGAVLGIILTAQVGTLRGDAGKETEAERIARLIKQLGDDAFRMREAASKELDAIGEPALAALRKAASSDDAEIRRRTEQVVQAITARVNAAAAKKELAKWEGSWVGDPGVTMTIKGDRVTSATPSTGPRNGTIKFIEVGAKVTQVDILVEEGDTKGQTFKAICRIDGETLHYCGTYSEVRPVDFRSQGANYYIPWKRVKK